MRMTMDPHPRLDLVALRTEFAQPLGDATSPGWLSAGLAPSAPNPFSSDADVKSAVRDLLRYGGYKPTGRGKPASEYLARAAAEGRLDRINPAVDVCNVVSLHSALPISVIDADRAIPPFHVGLAAKGCRYTFNAAGQEIDVGHLLCLHDAQGPCANAVKDAQRTKTHSGTRRTLMVIWGARSLAERTRQAADYSEELLSKLGASTVRLKVELVTPADGHST